MLSSICKRKRKFKGKKIKILRCDNGKEYIYNRFNKFVNEKGNIFNNCPAYVHQLNGTAERFNRTIMDMSRCLLHEAKVHKCYWPEIVCAATYLKNRTLANTIERKTPYEIFFKKKPNVENLRLYGNKVFVRIPEQKRLSKWDKKADMGTLVGYSEVGYRVLINNKILIARNVDIVETKIKCINLDDDERESNIFCSTSTLESFRGNGSDLGDDDVFKNENEMNEQESKVKQKETVV